MSLRFYKFQPREDFPSRNFILALTGRCPSEVNDGTPADTVKRKDVFAGWYNRFREILFCHPSDGADFSISVGLPVVVMDLKQLTEEMHRFVQAKGWYAPDSPRPQTPRNTAISLVLESAEVLEHFQWGETANPDMEEELADTALYLLQLASLLHIDLEKAILEKMKANYSRQWPNPPAAKATGP
jgi:NTP pyrophosphatase (non-canonical NTP hydrolase)